MKNKFILFSLTFLLTMSTPCSSYATELTQPEKPDIHNEQAVNQYNQEVGQYNKQIDKIYQEELKEYNDAVDYNNQEKQRVDQVNAEQEEIVNQHNTEENAKVEQNQKDLEKQEKINTRIKHDTNNGLENSTSNPNSAPTTFEGETKIPKTTIVEKSDAPTDIFYKLVNIHIFTDGKDYFDDTEIFPDKFSLAESLLAQAVLIEWETVLANENDIVHAHSQDVMWNGQYGMFRRCLKGYTNGVWWGNSGICLSDAINCDSKYINGSWEYYHSYNEGTDWNRDMDNVIIYWIYSFIRYGAEPEEVTKYIPDYWTVKYETPNYLTAIVPIKGKYLSPINYVPLFNENKNIVTPLSEDNNFILVPSKVKSNTTTKTHFIENNKVPLHHSAHQKTAFWALLNLLITIFSIILSILFIILYFYKRKSKEENDNQTRIKEKSFIKRLFSTLCSIVAVIIFIFTEDMSLPMQWTDKYTILMAIILILQIIGLIIIKKKEDQQDNNN